MPMRNRVTGPVYHFVRWPNDMGTPIDWTQLQAQGLTIEYGDWALLGTAEYGPEIDWTASFEPVFNDLSGSKDPQDQNLQGATATIVSRLTRWNNDVYLKMQTITMQNGNPLGDDFNDKIGAFTFDNKYHFQYAMRFSFDRQPPGPPDLEQGYMFYYCLLPKQLMSPLGARPQANNLVVFANKAYIGNRKHRLYTRSLDGQEVPQNPINEAEHELQD